MDFDSSIYEAVKTIIDEWYPHGLVSCCCASVHEFGAEAAMIAVRIEPNMNVRQISAVISDVFNTQFPDKILAERKCRAPARRILRSIKELKGGKDTAAAVCRYNKQR